MTRSWALLRHLDWVADAVPRNPVLAARMSREGCSSRDFLNAFNFWLEGIPTRFMTTTDAAHIRRRAKQNRKRNKAARGARRLNREAA